MSHPFSHSHIHSRLYSAAVSHTFTLTFIRSCSLTFSHLHSHAHTLIHSHSQMLLHIHTHSHTYFHTHILSHTFFHSITRVCSPGPGLILSHLCSCTQSCSHTFSHTCTHSYSHTFTLTHSHTDSFTHGHTHTCLAHTSSPTAGQTCAPCPLEVWVGGLQGRRLCGEPAWRAPWPSEPALSCGQCEHSRKGVAWPPVPWEDLVQKASQADMVTCREPHRDAAEQSTCRGSCADAGESRTNAAPLSLGNITPALPWDSGARQAEGGENHIK